MEYLKYGHIDSGTHFPILESTPATLRPKGKPMSEQIQIAQSVMEGGGAYNNESQSKSGSAMAGGEGQLTVCQTSRSAVGLHA
jgi:hypothetical protein